jgi:hypothetical protein
MATKDMAGPESRSGDYIGACDADLLGALICCPLRLTRRLLTLRCRPRSSGQGRLVRDRHALSVERYDGRGPSGSAASESDSLCADEPQRPMMSFTADSQPSRSQLPLFLVHGLLAFAIAARLDAEFVLPVFASNHRINLSARQRLQRCARWTLVSPRRNVETALWRADAAHGVTQCLS